MGKESQKNGLQWQAHTCIFIGNTLASAVRPEGYFKLESVSGSPVQEHASDLESERCCRCSHATEGQDLM